MANKNKNKLGSGTTAKTRIVVTLVAAAVVVVAGVVVWHHHHEVKNEAATTVSVASAPDIDSEPGVGNPSNEYVKNQNLQNQMNAEKARKDATSSVPTITRPNFIGNPDEFGQLPSVANNSDNSASHTCPLNKVVVMFKPNPASCTPKNLKLARAAGVTAEELRCQGCSCPALKLAGYGAGDLKATGFTAKSLHHCGYSLGQLIAAGFSAADLHSAGFTAKQLADDGFTAGQLASAGFSPKEIMGAGYTQAQLKAAGVLDKVICNVTALKKARANGESASALRAKGCGLAALKAAGYTASQLKAAGFTAGQLKAAGFNDQQLRAAGFTPAELKSTENLAKLCNIASLRKQRIQGVSAKTLHEEGCGLAALKAAGYTATELRNAGFNAAQLKAAGFSAKQLRDAGFTAAQLKAAGFDAKQLKDAGFDASELKSAGFSAGQLKAAGFSAAQLGAAGFSAKQLHDAGFSAAALRNAGFTPSELSKAGYTKGDLLRAGFTPKEAGYSSATASMKQQKAVKNAGIQTIPTNSPNSTNASASIPSINGDSREAELARLARQQQAMMTAQQRTDAIQTMQGAMTMQAQKMLADWSNHSQQTYKKGLVVKPQAGAGNGDGKGVNAADLHGPIFKAGDVMFATLDTSINSDEKSPILATIVAGKLKGAKLIGQFTRVNKRVLINFNLISIPHYDKSIALNAVAIDPDTARTALAGSVNNHYLLRYGSLFASAFLSGMAGAVENGNSTTQCIGFGCVTTHKQLNLSQQILAGMGKVGDRYGSVMSNNFNVPPTIKIPGGIGIGVLLMQDITLPLDKSN